MQFRVLQLSGRSLVSNVIPSIIIFSSGIPELWTTRTYTPSRRREKNEFGISRGYISIILIYFEGFHQNVEILKKLLKTPEKYIKFQKYGNPKMHMNTSILLSVVFLPLPTHTNHRTRVHRFWKTIKIRFSKFLIIIHIFQKCILFGTQINA